jgi:hypothetical protein
MREHRRNSIPPGHLAVATAILVLVGGCQDTLLDVPIADRIVVEAFLFAGEPVTDVRLTLSVPISSADTTPESVNDATVRLIRDGISYELASSDSAGHYAYPGDDLEVREGDHFQLEVVRGADTITAETDVPAPAGAISLSQTVVSVPTVGAGTGGPPAGGFALDSLVVSWENPDSLLHFLALESLDPDAESLFPDSGRGFPPGTRFLMRYEPTRASEASVNPLSLSVLGPYAARVYRVNQEYADLYENRTQDSRDLNEPPTNIHGGLGIFSAFSSRTADFTVVRN